MEYLKTWVWVGGIIFIIAYLVKYHKHRLMDKELITSPEWFWIINGLLIGIAIAFNFSFDQLFCTPVNWGTMAVALFIIAFFSIPLSIQNRRQKALQAAVLGAGVFILVYIIVFASDEYLTVLIFFSLMAIPTDIVLRYLQKTKAAWVANVLYFPLIVLYTPYFMLLQLARYYRSLTTPKLKRVFVGSPLLVLVIGLALTFRMNYLIAEIDTNKNNPQTIVQLLDNPIDNYLGELILGSHWKYHTELCMYDGTRPPLHDPVLGFAHMLHLHTGVSAHDENFALYRQVFPNNSYTFNCQCSY